MAALLVAMPRCQSPVVVPEVTSVVSREAIGAAETATPATVVAAVTLPATPTAAPSPTLVAATPIPSTIPSPEPSTTPAVRVALSPDLPARVADVLRAWATEEKVAVVGEEGGNGDLR